jgi:hypothetical protein
MLVAVMWPYRDRVVYVHALITSLKKLKGADRSIRRKNIDENYALRQFSTEEKT